MKKLFTAAMLLAMTTMSANAQLKINELMQSNVECIMDDINEFPDSWVELYNSGTTAVNLQDYKLGTKNDANKAWQLPNQQVLAGGYVIIYCDKEEGINGNLLHTDFRLESGKDGNLYLFTGGEVVDKLEKMAKMPAPDVAYGRQTDGGETWGYELNPTPGAQNTGGVVGAKQILGAPVFSQKGRVSNTSFNLTLTLPEGAPEGAVIRYTTNGTEPTATSTPYSGPIAINSTTVIRAKVFCEGWLSPVSTAQSYIFHPRSMTVPIFSIQTKDAYINDRTIGIYPNNTSKQNQVDWRRPINIEMFTSEDSESEFNQLGETRIQGGESRKNALKSMAIYANKRFDPDHKRFDYEFFPDQKPGINQFKSFSLRDGGNDFTDLYFRDLIIQRTMGQNTDLDWQAGHAAVLYINGEYMGMLNIRERSNEDNIYSNYSGLEDIDMIEISHEQERVNWQVVNKYVEELKEGTLDNYNAFKEFYSVEGHTLAEYEQWMDVSEYLNIMIMNLFYANLDFPGNNIVFWRPNENDTKSDLPKRWRFIAKDTDFGLGLYNRQINHNTLDMLYNPSNYSDNWAFTEPATRLIKNMLEDPDILNLFIDKCSVFMGDFMNGTGTGEMIDIIKEESLAEFVAHRAKYPSSGGNTQTQIETKFNNAKTWAESRPNYFYDFVRQQWNLGTAIPVTINKEMASTDLPDEVLVNGIKLTKSVFDGKLYLNRVITLEGNTGLENEKKVTGWEIKTTTNGSETTEYVEGATYTFTVPSCTKLIINAIMADKQPQIVADELLAFEIMKGETDSKTFEVLAEELFEDVTVTLSDPNGVFSIDVTSITQEEASAGKDITVTFNPQEEGEYSATLTLTSSNKEVVVTLNGVAYDFVEVEVGEYGLTTFYYDKPLLIPYDRYPLDLLGVYYAREATGTELKMKFIPNNIPANEGVVVQANSGTYRFPIITPDKATALSPANILSGTLDNVSTASVKESNPGKVVMTLGRGTSGYIGFYKYSGKTLYAHKAYLLFDSSSSSNVNVLSMGGIGGGEFTAIEDINTRVEEDAWYTLQGVRLNGTPKQRGIYIRNGKTVMVK